MRQPAAHLARGQTEFQVNLKLGLTPMTRGFIVCGDGTREQIDNSEELRAWVLDLAGRIRAARARVREVIPVIPRLGQCRPRGMRGYCGQARISDDGQAGASEPMKESNSYRTVPRQSSGRGLHQPTGGTGRLVRIPNTSARVGHIDRSVERRGGIESAPVISAPESSWTESTHLNQHSPPSVGLSVCYPKAEFPGA